MSFWHKRRVLVTGCTGLLGSWLVKSLLEKKASVVGVIRDELPDSYLALGGFRGKIAAVTGAVEDYRFVQRTIHEYEAQTVFHLAAQTIVTVANHEPRETFEVNIKGTWNVLEACRHARSVEGVLIASSDKAYGVKAKLPYRETDPLCGTHPYDVSKSCADLIARAYFETYALPVCIVRCGNLYGGGDLNFSRIIPGTIRSAFYNEAPVIRSDGLYVRDYFYVEDAVEAYLKLAEKMKKGIWGEAFNFSSGVHVNVRDLVGRILTLMGKRLKPRVLCQTKNEIKEQYLSIDKARRMLGWGPAISLNEGLVRTIQWYSDYFASPGERV
jgi:CDP-glucose 4,6-dehydratase